MSTASPAQLKLAWVVCWLTPVLWTTNLVVARTAPGVVTPNVLALGRWSLAGLVLALIARQELWQHRHWIRGQAWRYLILGACGMWVCGAWVYLAAFSTSAMNISLIYASAPVFIALGSVWWLGEHFTSRQWVGVAIALSGVVHVVVRGEWMHLAQVALVPGDLWVLAASLAWAAYCLLQRHWPSPLGPTAQLAVICAGGVAVLLPCALWELAQPDAPTLGRQAWGLIALGALVPGLMAYWIYGWTQKVLGVSRVAVTMYLGPLYAALIAWFFLGEPLGWHHAAGAALILSGVALVMAARRAR